MPTIKIILLGIPVILLMFGLQHLINPEPHIRRTLRPLGDVPGHPGMRWALTHIPRWVDLNQPYQLHLQEATRFTGRWQPRWRTIGSRNLDIDDPLGSSFQDHLAEVQQLMLHDWLNGPVRRARITTEAKALYDSLPHEKNGEQP